MAQVKDRRVARMRRELIALFGEPTVLVAGMVDPALLTLTADLMDRVHDAADAVLARTGRPAVQRRYVAELPSDVRLLLCMWLMDTGLAAKLTRRAVQGV
ncbi:MAG: hypothetical protein ACK59M_18560 [Pseudomonadota bacterium]|jgi:hypothetical protein